jgi:hypothetical protein
VAQRSVRDAGDCDESDEDAYPPAVAELAVGIEEQRFQDGRLQMLVKAYTLHGKRGLSHHAAPKDSESNFVPTDP